jgi:hypothetical protein
VLPPPDPDEEAQDKFPDVSDDNTYPVTAGYPVGNVYNVVDANPEGALKAIKNLESVLLKKFKDCPIDALPDIPTPPLIRTVPEVKDVEFVPNAEELLENVDVVPYIAHLNVALPNSLPDVPGTKVADALSLILTKLLTPPGGLPGEYEALYPLNVIWSRALPPKEIDCGVPVPSFQYICPLDGSIMTSVAITLFLY